MRGLAKEISGPYSNRSRPTRSAAAFWPRRLKKSHSRRSRDPPISARDDAEWVPAFAGNAIFLCRRFFVLGLAADRAGILAFGVGVAVDQLDDRHRRVVAVAVAGLDDAGIAAGPGGVALGEDRQQLVGEHLILQPGDRQAPA